MAVCEVESSVARGKLGTVGSTAYSLAVSHAALSCVLIPPPEWAETLVEATAASFPPLNNVCCSSKTIDPAADPGAPAPPSLGTLSAAAGSGAAIMRRSLATSAVNSCLFSAAHSARRAARRSDNETPSEREMESAQLVRGVAPGFRSAMAVISYGEGGLSSRGPEKDAAGVRREGTVRNDSLASFG